MSYLRRAGNWVWLLVLLPLVCVAGAFALDKDSSTSWTGTASMFTAPSLTARSGAQYVNDVQAALVSDAVVGQVAAQSGLRVSEVRAGLSSKVLAPGGSVLGVTFEAADRTKAEQVPAAAARAALRALVAPQLEQAQQQVRAAEDDSERALRAREAFVDDKKVQLPLQTYTQGLAEVAQLRVAAATARLEGRDGASGLADLLEERQKAVAKIAPLVPEFEALDSDVQRTYVQLNTVRTDLASAQSELAAVDNGQAVVSSPAVEASTSRLALQRAVSAAVVGLLVALLVLVAIVALGRRRSGEAQPDGEAARDAREQDLSALTEHRSSVVQAGRRPA